VGVRTNIYSVTVSSKHLSRCAANPSNRTAVARDHKSGIGEESLPALT
jgi:hypothetical protein